MTITAPAVDVGFLIRMLAKISCHDPYFAYTDDHVQQHREHLRCLSVHHRNEGVRQRRLAKKKERKEFVLHGSTCCGCVRPPANEDNNMFWCLLCTKPTGDQDADDAGTMAFAAPPEEAAEDQGVRGATVGKVYRCSNAGLIRTSDVSHA